MITVLWEREGNWSINIEHPEADIHVVKIYGVEPVEGTPTGETFGDPALSFIRMGDARFFLASVFTLTTKNGCAMLAASINTTEKIHDMGVVSALIHD